MKLLSITVSREQISIKRSPLHIFERVQQAKNEFEKEVTGVIDGLQEKAGYLTKKIEEKEQQERARAAEQCDLGRKLDRLIDHNQPTNETIQLLLQTVTSRN